MKAKAFGLELKRLREAMALSQQDVTDALDLNHDTVPGWERGEHKPQASTRRALAKLYQVEPQALYLVLEGVQTAMQCIQARLRAKDLGAEATALLRSCRRQEYRWRRQAKQQEVDVRRRTFIMLSGSTAAGILLNPLSPGLALAQDSEDDSRLLGHCAQVTMGAGTGLPEWMSLSEAPTEGVKGRPARVTAAHVRQLEAITASLRAMDYRCGGGACIDALLGHLKGATQLLSVPCEDQVRVELVRLVADLNNQAGWESFDTGKHGVALAYYGRALEQAQAISEWSLAANVLCQMGWVYLHLQRPQVALKYMQLAQLAAQNTACELTVALQIASQAWAYGALGDEHRMRQATQRAQDEYARSDLRNAPPWLQFFVEPTLHCLLGCANAALPMPSAQAYKDATTNLYQAVQTEWCRERALYLSRLARVHLVNGDVDVAVNLGMEAVALAESLQSVLVLERLMPLRQAALDCGSQSSGAAELAQGIARLH